MNEMKINVMTPLTEIGATPRKELESKFNFNNPSANPRHVYATLPSMLGPLKPLAGGASGATKSSRKYNGVRMFHLCFFRGGTTDTLAWQLGVCVAWRKMSLTHVPGSYRVVIEFMVGWVR